MLSYKHGFHAGNYADVLKHTVFIQLLAYLSQKDKAFCCIDTHAGPGDYSLTSEYALKNREFDSGISRLWERTDLPEALDKYVRLIKLFNPPTRLSRYPGSPLIAQQFLRPQDRLIVCELHNNEVKQLAHTLPNNKQITIVHADGLQHTLAVLPPIERRGVILIDPSYEIKSDYQRVADMLSQYHKRFATGTYALWYPVVERKRIRALERNLQQSGIKNILQLELCIKADSIADGMTGCGMIVINPPWTLQACMQAALPWLAAALGQDGEGSFRVQVLVAE